MNQSVRVRYAPSPTGYPHVGNIRTALFNWLFARHYGGSFILRIEDTDVARKVAGTVEAILASLRWLDLDWDECPYFQSQRLEIYRETAQRLVKEGHAYFCYCSPQRLAQMRAEQMRLKQPPGYDRRCRSLSQREQAQFEAEGITPVVRFKMLLEGQTVFQDLVRGELVFENSTLDDFVLLKSDGYPTYHLANIVDDHSMEISHVLRADEWLSSTPRHVLLYQALGYQPPLFAHLPMILGPDRSKLSKRHGAVSILDYKEQGYLPQAMFNFLSLLGWSLDDRTELLSQEEIVKHFSLDRLSKAPAIFSREKLNWMNGVYLRSLYTEEFTQQAMPFLDKGLPPEVARPLPIDYVKEIAPLVQERAKTLAELPQLTDFFFVDNLEYEPALLLGKGKSMNQETASDALTIALEIIQGVKSFDASSLEDMLRPLAAELSLKTGEFFGLLRVAVTGRTVAPPLFQTMAVLGKERCRARVDAAIHKLKELQVRF